MRQIIALSTLLALALVGSYTTYYGEKTKELRTGEVPIYKAGTVTQVAWTSEKMDVVLDHKTDARGEYVWVTVTERREAPKPMPPPDEPPAEGAEDEAGADDEEAGEAEDSEAEEPAPPEEPPEIITTSMAFKGNGTADELWENLNPLIAMRPLTLAQGEEDPFGFDEPDANLALATGAGELSLVVGGETFGSKDRYVQHKGDAFLVDDQTLRPLQYGKTRLLERILQPLAEQDVDSIKLVTPDGTLSFGQQNAGDRAKAFWSLDSDPEAEHPVAGPWFGKVFKMRAKQYVEDPSTLGELTPVFRFETTGDGETWAIEVVKSSENPGAFYARSDFLRSTVELTKSLATDAVVDLKQVFE